jgi:hypothetical protein
MKNREDQRNKTKVDNSVNVFGEKFLDKYSVNIRDQIEKFSKKIAGLKTLADRPKDDPYKKRLDNWRIG